MVQGKFEATGIRPRFLEQVMAHGVTLVGRPVPARHEVRRMNDIWLRALILVCIFGAVVLAVEALVGWIVEQPVRRQGDQPAAKMIGRGPYAAARRMNLLRRADQRVAGRPAAAARPARRTSSSGC